MIIINVARLFGRYPAPLLASFILSGVAVFPLSLATAQTTAQSVATDGTLGDQRASYPAVSPNGQYIVYESDATNLVTGDTNNATDIFVRDRTAGTTDRASLSTSGTQVSDASFDPSVSSNGRYVAFWSGSPDFVSSDTNGSSDVFLRDRTSGTTTRVSVANDGSESNDSSFFPRISASGRYIIFESYASNLTTTSSNNKLQVYRRDTVDGTTKIVSTSSAGVSGDSDVQQSTVALTDDGDIIIFVSDASNLVSGDTNQSSDIFVKVLSTNATSRVSVNSLGTQANKSSGNPTSSADGRYVAFESNANTLVTGDTNRVSDVFLHDRNTALTSRVSVGPSAVQANGASSNPQISPDGRYVAYESIADNLVAGMPSRANGDLAPDIFVYDRVSGTTVLAGIATDGTRANDFVIRPAISSDGLVVTFESAASNLISGIIASFDIVYANVDQCPADPNKRAPGVCGCGIADSDDDGDGILACGDACPTDPDKSAAGSCGCGLSDEDTDGSGAADCLDPKFNTVPGAPTLKKSGKKVALTMEEFSSDKVEYRWFIYAGKKVIKSGKSTSNTISVELKLAKSTKVFAQYSVQLGGIISNLSGHSDTIKVSKAAAVKAKPNLKKRRGK